ncbi:RHS repeat-associated core domain-containing protein [Arenibacter sp. M-2]|uniref:RHS repeat-associated core domain-containing protein n=1 Tax=Arenibacter sp. M-2 TaxID=3053612 RepID=UPI00257058B5|nr:RHS repeat-associated core domain-containing protein [Arenibacter sp. M-2]MDL5514696.1 RHS repeat-associated core domain-containing protein [Arenibacter sp. M-2]
MPKTVEDYTAGFEYVYNYKDHLGNIRLSYTDANGDGDIDVTNDPMTTEIVKESNYYPFGLQHKGYNNVVNGAENNYKDFQGQELTKDLGLNVHEWKYRFGDPAIARFWQIDPLAEDYVYNGTYNFSENDPISSVELEGLEKLSVHVYNVIQNNNGGYTATFQMQTTTTGHNWSGTKSQQQIQVLDSYDRKTVTNLYTGDMASANAQKDGFNITEWKGRDVSASDIWKGAKNNPEFKKAGETLKNVVAAGGLVLAGPAALSGEASFFTYMGVATDANVLLGGENGAATDAIDNKAVQGVVQGVSILSAVGAKNEAINVFTTSTKTSEKTEATVALSKSLYDMIMSFFNNDKEKQNE